LDEGVQVLKMVDAGGGIDFSPVKHGKGVPRPGSSVAKRRSNMLGVEHCHAKERVRNNAVIFVTDTIAARGDNA
jgi:hypothetical protein